MIMIRPCPLVFEWNEKASPDVSPLHASKISSPLPHFSIPDPGYNLCVGWTSDAG